jgi:two-component system sensor histidine kinase/response regulator
MDRTLHDMGNDLAVAIGTVHALVDGKLPADPERLSTVLKALKSLNDSLNTFRTAASAAVEPDKEQLLSAVIEGSPYAKVLVNRQGAIVLVNVQAEELFGYARSELIGASLEMLVPERFRRGHPELRSHFNDAPIARPMGAGRELYGRRKDESEFPIEIGLNPITTAGETFTLAAISDISERKRSEELRLAHVGVQRHAAELEELNSELAAASRFKTEFVSTMSHELRTPLGAIIGAAELLGKADLDAQSAGLVHTIAGAAEGLFALTNSVLDFSKIEAGKMDLDVTEFDIASLVEGVVAVVAPAARAKRLPLNVFIDPNIPVVRGDRDRLRQIVLNLLANAEKFTAAGRIDIRVTPIAITPRTVTLRFEVSDSGIGIAPDVLARLFEPFAQADRSSSRRFAGTGLGLSISKRLITLMGGEIGVRSEAGNGSTFWFVVQFERFVPAALPEPSVESLTATGTVLVAEDNEQLQNLLQLQFNDLGVPVAFVSNGQAALEAVRHGRYAMVFMDCQMPDLDGLEATRRIRKGEVESGGHIPIAAMTANGFAEDRAACIAAGMDDYLAKPIRLGDLRTMIERWTTR